MQHRFIIGALVALLSIPALASASDDFDGKALYEKNCSSCHGVNGEPTALGKSLKPFAARNHRAIAKYVERDELRRIITYGIKGTAMTAKKYTLDPLEIEAVIDHIKTFNYKPNLANGKKRFKAVCSSCHGFDGRAKTGIGAKNLVYSKLNLDEVVHTMRYGRPGTLMTSKRHQLSNTDIADIANYVYSLRYMANPANGQKLYSKNCASCHSTPRDIKLIGNAAARRTVSDLDNRLLDLRIRHGRHVDRAGEKVAHLSADDMQDVVAYIRHDLN
ncbi:MAG: c-type cytochrome [Mariprofundaceae bacterium]|nr:c-type cytochrome [Mariprofundaceae bacterium]